MFLSPYCSLIALCLSGGVAADGWDDFTNNLASDLAPIISLFGEQATKQYLSESITWLDYFIFAMAPIGILTALVSAIRVCGSPSLKAFIGRAKEAAGNVEAELLSSTSRNVCELYNGGGIERIIGRPKILEVVLDRNVADEEFTREGGSAGIYTFADYVRNENHRQEWRPWPHREGTEPSKGDGPKTSEEYGPNLSHNVSIKRLDDWWFRLVGVIGFVLQRLDSQGNRLSEQEISAMMISSDTLKGHELDWLALHIGREEVREGHGVDRRVPSMEKGGRTWRLCGLDISWPREKDIEKASQPGETSSERRSYSWLFFGTTKAGERITHHASEANSSEIGLKSSESAGRQNRVDCVNRILAYRRTLARLTEQTTAKLDLAVLTRHFSHEMVAVRETARQLVLAIELVANSVCSSSTAIIMKELRAEHNDLYCTMNCGISPRAGVQIAKVVLHLRRGGKESRWMLEGKENVEAMLGLWTWSLISESARHHSQLNVTRRRIVSSGKHPEEVGFYKWFRSAAGRPVKHTLKGLNNEFGPSTFWLNEQVPKGTSYQLFGWYSGEPLHLSSPSAQSEIDVFTLPTTSDLLSLCAQEILGTFVKSILDLVKSIGEVEDERTC
ncbi:hypothetical protein K4K48_007606 [Colletotrichum sp. SAR 10_66]|nr:hypothetical protein K4K48_007606 [Colletotrichum sp. SAR 10_66]